MTHLEFYLKWNKIEEKYEVDFMLSNMPKQEVIITMDLKQALRFANSLNDSIVDKMQTIIDTIPKLYDKKEIKSDTQKPQDVVIDKVQLVKIIEGVQEKGICKDNFIITVLELWENIKTADTPEQQESE